ALPLILLTRPARSLAALAGGGPTGHGAAGPRLTCPRSRPADPAAFLPAACAAVPELIAAALSAAESGSGDGWALALSYLAACQRSRVCASRRRAGTRAPAVARVRPEAAACVPVGVATDPVTAAYV